MKLIAYISGSLFTSITLLSMLFKIMHWPGGAIGLIIGYCGLALIFVPSFAVYRYNKIK
ncbi:GldL-related protein [Brumimicrobium glaciale]|uniref:GldL-related protein n=1 Tax=Brumimicrobium glaciale TaxID=200475 RepID=UPI0013EC22D4|nr:hypothetical protein [Brumimicrobium glaciale]